MHSNVVYRYRYWHGLWYLFLLNYADALQPEAVGFKAMEDDEDDNMVELPDKAIIFSVEQLKFILQELPDDVPKNVDRFLKSGKVIPTSVI